MTRGEVHDLMRYVTSRTTTDEFVNEYPELSDKISLTMDLLRDSVSLHPEKFGRENKSK